MSNQRILTLYPYLYPGTACWVFDDARTGLKPPPGEECRRFVEAPR